MELPVKMLLFLATCMLFAKVMYADLGTTTTAVDGITSVNGLVSKVTDTMEKTKDALALLEAPGKSVLKAIKALTSVVGALGTIGAAVGAFAAIFSFVLSFFVKSQSEIMMEEFAKVNGKLDALAAQMSASVAEIKVHTELTVWHAQFSGWTTSIRTAEELLGTTMEGIKKNKYNERKRLSIALHFTEYYENNQIHDKLMKIYAATKGEPDALEKNFIELYRIHNECNITALSNLMSLIRTTVVQAQKLSLAYNIFKGFDERAEKSFNEINDIAFAIRRNFEKNVLYCLTNAIPNAKALTEKVTNANKDLGKGQLAATIQSELANKIPWLQWAVVMTRTDEQQLEIPPWTSFGLVYPYYIYSKNMQYYSFHYQVKPGQYALVIWQQQMIDDVTCDDINTARGHIVWWAPELAGGEKGAPKLKVLWRKLTREEETLAADPHMLSYKQCDCNKKYRSQCQYLQGGLRAFIGGMDWIEYSWYTVTNDILQRNPLWCAVQFNSHRISPCPTYGHPCGKNGDCIAIPHTDDYVCHCHQFYDGDHCEKYTNIAAEKAVDKVIAQMRSDTGKLVRVPNIVDVMLALRDLRKDLTVIMTNQAKILASIDVTSAQARSENYFLNAKYVAEIHSDFLSGVIDAYVFNMHLEEMGMGLDLMGARMKYAVMNDDIFSGDDMMTIFKKKTQDEVGDANVCSSTYVEKVKGFRNLIIFLQESVFEAAILHAQWKMRHSPQFVNELKAYTESIYEESKQLNAEYWSFWETLSCPPIYGNDLKCYDGMTLEGQTVTVSKDTFRWNLDSQKHTYTEQATCVKDGSVLKWDKYPFCNEKWQSFVCDSGECLWSGKRCDGTKDCKDGSDESDCTLRSGDKIGFMAFKHIYNNSHPCPNSNNAFEYKSKCEKCKPFYHYRLNCAERWCYFMAGKIYNEKYYSEEYVIRAKDRADGQPIKDGDSISLWQGDDSFVTYYPESSSYRYSSASSSATFAHVPKLDNSILPGKMSKKTGCPKSSSDCVNQAWNVGFSIISDHKKGEIKYGQQVSIVIGGDRGLWFNGQKKGPAYYALSYTTEPHMYTPGHISQYMDTPYVDICSSYPDPLNAPLGDICPCVGLALTKW